MNFIFLLAILYCLYSAWVVWKGGKSLTAKMILSVIILYIMMNIIDVFSIPLN